MFHHFLDLFSLDFWSSHFFVSADCTVRHHVLVYTLKAAVKRSHSHCQVNHKSLLPAMSEALRQGLGYYLNIALLIGQWVELIMQSKRMLMTGNR